MKVRDKEVRFYKIYLKIDRCNMYLIGKFWRDVNEVGIIVKFLKVLNVIIYGSGWKKIYM